MPDPLLDFARLCHEGGESSHAEQAYRRVLERDPNHAEALGLLAALLITLRRAGEAIPLCEGSLKLRPRHAPTLANLGIARLEVGQTADAERSLAEAQALDPSRPEVEIPLAKVWRTLGRTDEALALLRGLVKAHPGHVNAWNDLGVALQHSGRLSEAVECFREAVGLDPRAARAYSNLGTVLQELGRLGEALAAYDDALRITPGEIDARWNRATARLLSGDLANGWTDFHARWAAVGQPAPRFDRPEWDGSPTQRQTLLIHAEQGLGDTLQFVRYARKAQQRGCRVVLACQGALAHLLGRSPGVDSVVPFGQPLPDFDRHIALMDLPGLFGTTLDTVPAEVPYLFARPDLVEQWGNRLGASEALRVGVAWQGRTDHPRDSQRSFPLAALSPLMKVAGVRWFSLQHGEGLDQLDEWGGRLGVTDLGLGAASIEDTAAVIANLDLVVTPDTAIAHLAGGLGRPTWVALPHAPDWRWLLDRSDSPWYSTSRLFRQTEAGGWSPVFVEMARELADGAIRPRTIGDVPVSPSQHFQPRDESSLNPQE